MNRAFNFSAGPAMLPLPVLEQVQKELLDYKGSGMSVMEMSHRSSFYQLIFDETKQDIIDLLNIPDEYDVLFIQGGASMQFSMIPMNLMKNCEAGYILTGNFSKKAAKEGNKYGKINILASSEDDTFSYIPDVSNLDISDTTDYVYICENNTIFGTKFKNLPDTKGKPLVADVSSCFLSEPMDVSKYDLIFGGVQKNIGPAGMAIVILKKSLISDFVLGGTPTMLKYSTYSENNSMYNTPPSFNIYVCGLVFKWLKSIGGLDSIYKMNVDKASVIYDFLDQSKLFKTNVRKSDRSLMNVTFITGDKEMDDKFIAEAAKSGFENIKGHRSVGGMRASIYNAMPKAGVQALVDFMDKFEKRNLK